VFCQGPLTQSDFLNAMGVEARVEMLMRNTKNLQERKSILKDYERLVDPNQMGSVYKIMAIGSKKSLKSIYPFDITSPL